MITEVAYPPILMLYDAIETMKGTDSHSFSCLRYLKILLEVSKLKSEQKQMYPWPKLTGFYQIIWWQPLWRPALLVTPSDSLQGKNLNGEVVGSGKVKEP